MHNLESCRDLMFSTVTIVYRTVLHRLQCVREGRSYAKCSYRETERKEDRN